MRGTLPGGAISPSAITDLQLLNVLDQIRDAAIFSTSLTQETREAVVQAVDSVKRSTPRARPSGAYPFAGDWEAKLLTTLSNQVAKITESAEQLDEKTGKTVLEILNPYVGRF